MVDARQSLIRRFAGRPLDLEGGLRLRVEPIDDRRGRLRVEGPQHTYEARAVALSVPYPSGLKRLLASEPEAEVVLVERASRGFDHAAVENGVGYLDLRARGRLIGPGFVYVAPPLVASSGPTGRDVENRGEGAGVPGSADPWYRSPPWRETPSRVSPFAPKASRVVRALLHDVSRRWKLSELADLCRMNPGNVHRVLGALVDRGFAERDGGLYLVEDPGSLLEAWAENGKRGQSRDRVALPVRDGLHEEVLSLLQVVHGRGVVSGELAAELLAPYLPASQAIFHCIDADALDAVRAISGDREFPRLRSQPQVIVDLADEGVADFSEIRHGLRVVSPAQLYFDLFRDRGRAREAADHVRRELLRY